MNQLNPNSWLSIGSQVIAEFHSGEKQGPSPGVVVEVSETEPDWVKVALTNVPFLELEQRHYADACWVQSQFLLPRFSVVAISLISCVGGGAPLLDVQHYCSIEVARIMRPNANIMATTDMLHNAFSQETRRQNWPEHPSNIVP